MPKQHIENLVNGAADAAKGHYDAYLEKDGAPQLEVVQTGRRLEEALAGRPELTHARKIWFDLLVPALRSHEVERASARRAFKERAISGGAVGIVVGVVTMYWLGFLAVILGAGIFSAFTYKQALELSEIGARSKKLILSSACELMGFRYHDHREMNGDQTSSSKSGNALKEIIGSTAVTRKLLNRFDLSGGGHERCPTPAMDALESYKLLGDFDAQSYDDMITGERAGARFSVVEATLKEWKGSGKSRRLETTFQGLLVHIEYPERFLGSTVITRRGKGRKMKRKTGLQPVDIVANEFSDDFDVLSNDQVEARALLTPDRLLRLIAMETRFKGSDIQAVFEDGHLTMALSCRDLFEVGDVKSGLVDESRFAICLDELGVICDVVDGYMTREWAARRV